MPFGERGRQGDVDYWVYMYMPKQTMMVGRLIRQLLSDDDLDFFMCVPVLLISGFLS